MIRINEGISYEHHNVLRDPLGNYVDDTNALRTTALWALDATLHYCSPSSFHPSVF